MRIYLLNLILTNLFLSLNRNRVSFLDTKRFSHQVRKHLITSTFLPLMDDGDLLLMNTSAQHLKKLDLLYHCGLRFMTDCSYHVHHYTLYATANYPFLSDRRLSHWLFLSINALLDFFSHIYAYFCVGTSAIMVCALRTSF